MSERFPGPMPTYRRFATAIATVAFSFGTISCATEAKPQERPAPTSAETCIYNDNGEHITVSLEELRHCLGSLAIKDKAPMAGYDRNKKFGTWRQKDGCDTRETILIRDLTEEAVNSDDCSIISGVFDDIYTAKNENDHVAGKEISNIEIDHVVALGDAWQSGIGRGPDSKADRVKLANDPLNLQATSRENNREKGDDDAFGWLPPSEEQWCSYVTRQVLVKNRYHLWVKPSEHNRIEKVLDENCKDESIVVPA